jgi:hypothetical protein
MTNGNLFNGIPEVEDTSEVNEETEPVPPLNDFRFILFR